MELSPIAKKKRKPGIYSILEFPEIMRFFQKGSGNPKIFLNSAPLFIPIFKKII